MFIQGIMQGMVAMFTVARSDLYRYPYRQSAEALRGDWKRIGKDVDVVIDSLEGENDE